MPRVAGGLGTTFFTAKIAVLDDDARAFKVASARRWRSSTAWRSGKGARRVGLAGQRAARSRGLANLRQLRLFLAGNLVRGGGHRQAGWRSRRDIDVVQPRLGDIPASSPEVPTVAGPRRNEISGGASYDLKPNIAVFGSISRTIGVAAEDGAGTTLGFGLSLSAAPTLLTR